MQLFDGAQMFTTSMGGRDLTIETGVLAAQAGGAVATPGGGRGLGLTGSSPDQPATARGDWPRPRAGRASASR